MEPIHSQGGAGGPRHWTARLERALVVIEETTSVLLLAVVLGLMFVQVVARYVFAAPLFWSDEMGRYCYVWLSFIASIALVGRRGHIRIDLINRFLGARAQRGVEILATVIVIGTCAFLVQGSWDWLLTNIRPTSPALRMPLVWLYGVVWLSFGLMALHALYNLVLVVSGKLDPVAEESFE